MPVIGKTSNGAAKSAGFLYFDSKRACKFTASGTFWVTKMGVHRADGWGSAETARLVIYDDDPTYNSNAGGPKNVLGQTDGILGSGADGWVTVDLQAPVQIVDGTIYWLTVHASDWVQFWYDASGATTRVNSSGQEDEYDDGPADPAPDNMGSSNTREQAIFAASPEYITNAGVLASGGGVFETSGGAVHGVWTNGNTIEVWDDLESSPALGDSDTAGTIFGGGTIGWVHACIDSSDLIHLVAQATATQTRTVAYASYNTATSTIGTWEVVFASYTDAAPTYPHCAITVDSSDDPVVLYTDVIKTHGTNRSQIFYDKRSGGTWDGSEQVNNSATADYSRPSVRIAPADDVEAVYVQDTATDIAYRRRNASWGTESTYSETTPLTLLDSINVLTADTTYRYHLASTTIEENNTSITATVTSASRTKASPAMADDLRHMAFVNASDELELYYNDGGWGSKEVIFSGTVTDVICDNTYGEESREYVQGVYRDSGGNLNFFRTVPRRVFVISHG